MNNSRVLQIMVLAAPLLLSGCGSGAGDDTRAVHSSAAKQSMKAALAVTPLEGPRADYVIAKTATGFTVTHKTTSATVAVAAGARLRFTDISVALDSSGTAGKAYRLYRAAFARTPDILGLSYWITAMDGGATPEAVAIEFAKSNEFKTVYGTAPTSAEIVARLYQNVLGRQGEPAGIAYWQGVLDSKAATVAGVLYGFSESPENKDAVQATIELGIGYNEPGVIYTPGPLIDPQVYASGKMAETMGEALSNYNAQGARGYAFVGATIFPSGSGNDLYQHGNPGETFTYKTVNVGGASAATRLATMQAEGAKGYLFKSSAIYGYDIANPYDVFVKSSTRNATYSYRMKAEGFNLASIKANGADGYAYRGQIVIDGTTQNLYVKDNSTSATYEYQTSTSWTLSDGKLLPKMNELGADRFAYQGSIYTGTEFLALFARSSAYDSAFSYATAVNSSKTMSEMLDALNLRWTKGERYYGDLMDGPFPISVYYKGPVIVHPLVGPVFP